MIDRELYVPRGWIADPDRCWAAGTPRGSASPPSRPWPEGCWPAPWTPGCRPPGSPATRSTAPTPKLRACLEARGIGYALAVACDHPVVAAGDTWRADALIRRVPARAWQCISAGQGAKGHRYYDWAFIRLDDGDASPGGQAQRWLLVRRNRRTRELAFYRCWTPRPVSLASLVRVAGRRWTIDPRRRRRSRPLPAAGPPPPGWPTPPATAPPPGGWPPAAPPSTAWPPTVGPGSSPRRPRPALLATRTGSQPLDDLDQPQQPLTSEYRRLSYLLTIHGCILLGRWRNASRPARAWPAWTSIRSAAGAPGTAGSPWPCSPRLPGGRGRDPTRSPPTTVRADRADLQRGPAPVRRAARPSRRRPRPSAALVVVATPAPGPRPQLPLPTTSRPATVKIVTWLVWEWSSVQRR
jgi:hypothetical protein